MKWIALSIVLAALILAGSVWATQGSEKPDRRCDDNPYTSSIPAC